MSNSCNQPEGFLSPKTFLELHFAICSIGLIGFVGMFSDMFVSSAMPVVPLVLNDYMKGFFFPRKPFDLAYFISVSAALFCYWGVVCLVLEKWWKVLADCFTSIVGCSRKRIVLVLLSDFLVSAMLLLLYCMDSLMNSNISLFSVNRILEALGTLSVFIAHVFVGPLVMIFAILWLVICLLPVILLVLSRAWDNGSGRVIKVASCVLLGFVLLQAMHMFKPFVFERLKMLNEYFDIPSTVYLMPKPKTRFSKQDVSERGVVLTKTAVNATAFTNERVLWWPLRKYDVDEKPDMSAIADASMCSFMASDAIVRNFVELMRDRRNYGYYYDIPSGNLCVQSVATPADLDVLRGLSLSSADNAHVTDLYASSTRGITEHSRRQLAQDEKQFLLSHRFEMHWQILNRWVIHHHNFVLGPVNELALGRNMNAINMQYGLLNAVLLERLLGLAGGVSYQAYFKVFYSFYYLYYALFVLLAFYMFRRVEYVLVTALLGFAALNSIGFQYLFLGPGGNPIRHFFDLFVIFGMLRYFSGGGIAWLFGSLFFALLAMLNNKEFGLFILLSLSGSLILRILSGGSRRKFIELLSLCGAAIAAIWIMLLPLGRDALAKYYMAGLLGFRLEFLPGFVLLLGFSISCFLVVHFLRKKGEFKYIVMLLLFYSQQLLVYYIWGGMVDHFTMYVPIYALTGAAVFKMCADASPRLKVRENAILVLAICAALCVYLPCVAKYYLAKREYSGVFQTHKTYEWTMPRARFLSTMNPSYFEASVALIRKYEPANGMYMLSKYDAFIPFLAGKYQAMPFPEMSQFLVTPTEVRKSIEALKKDRPPLLFVDSNMGRDLGRDIIRPEMPVWGYLSEESRWRVERLSLLQKIWREVSFSYEKIDSGGLLDVYRLKTEPAALSARIK